MSQSERSFIMIKPDGVQRNLVGEVIKRFEQKGFKLVGLKLMSVPRELAEEHYGDLSTKPFFPSLVNFIISSPVVAMVWEGAPLFQRIPQSLHSVTGSLVSGALIGTTHAHHSSPGYQLRPSGLEFRLDPLARG